MKKYIAPIIVTILVGLFILAYGFGIVKSLFSSSGPIWITILVAIVFLALFSALIATLIKRINEIKKEDKDDISKY